MARARSANFNNSSAQLGFEAKLWLAADKLRSNMDAAEYKHVVLGLIFAYGSRFPKTLRGKNALNTRHFFAELKRRNVYKVAVAYDAVAPIIMQERRASFR